MLIQTFPSIPDPEVDPDVATYYSSTSEDQVGEEVARLEIELRPMVGFRQVANDEQILLEENRVLRRRGERLSRLLTYGFTPLNLDKVLWGALFLF